jgi:hypothetical protein
MEVSFWNTGDEALLVVVARSGPPPAKWQRVRYPDRFSFSMCDARGPESRADRRNTRPHMKTYAADVLVCHDAADKEYDWDLSARGGP